MANRTHIVCLCEGEQGSSTDPIFINRLMREIDPPWIRPQSSNFVTIKACGNRQAVIECLPEELKKCLKAGGHETLMVWADCDHDCDMPKDLVRRFWDHAKTQGVTEEQFSSAVFVFAKDRLENWIEFLLTGATDESVEGKKKGKKRSGREATAAAMKLAEHCRLNRPIANIPPSLEWSCLNWKAFVSRMK
jgi:hypothetical protein